jgi:hypothetical protein
MFAPKVAKAQTKAAESSVRRLAPQRASLPARPFGGSAIDQLLLQHSIGNQATLRLLARQKSSTDELKADRAAEWVVDRLRRPPKSLGYDLGKAAVDAAVSEPGRPLDAATRARFESRFGADLAGVRLHEGPAADEAARGLGARAFTLSQHVVFRHGQYRPGSEPGDSLLAHELTHAAQQRHAVASPFGPPLSPSGSKSEREAEAAARAPYELSAIPASPVDRVQLACAPDPAAIADEVIAQENAFIPGASGGIGDYPAAFKILAGLDTETLLKVLAAVDAKFMLDLLHDYIGAATTDRQRIDLAILAVQLRTGRLGNYDRGRAPGLVAFVTADDIARIRSFLAPLSTHAVTIFLEGQSGEIDRLAKLQLQYWEDKRKAEEAAAQRAAEEAAKARGGPSPSKESLPKVNVAEVVEKEVAARAVPPIPTKEWDDLSADQKKKWTDERAPQVLQRVRDSLKGTELEAVVKSARFIFEPRKMLERGGYAYEDNGNLVVGMAFIKDAEKDPKNVWPIVAHEIGGHAAYGSTYAKKVMDKVLAALPEAERKKYTGPDATRFFDAFLYAETEIFSALRQRKYDVPEGGEAAPVHGAIKPDDNIEIRLKGIDAAFPHEVGLAILLELNARVQADSAILPRDKKYFVEQAKKHGYAL